MKKLLLYIVMAMSLCACSEDNNVTVVFEIRNLTPNGNLTVEFSSWGNYTVNHGESWIYPHEFHTTETVGPQYNITMMTSVKDDGYKGIPPTVTPAWEYITAIQCMRVKVPASYYTNPANWQVLRHTKWLEGEEILVTLELTPEILARFNQLQ